MNDYLLLREELLEKNRNLVGVVLNDKEKKADEYLQKIKQDFKEACDNDVSYKMPMLRDERIWQSSLYTFCKKLPKGADLHVHSKALLPFEYLFDFLMGRDDVYLDMKTLVMRHKNSTLFNDDCVLFKKVFEDKLLSRDDLYKKWTLLGKTHYQKVWPYFHNLFYYCNELEDDRDLCVAYYQRVFAYYYSLNIHHLEIHSMLKTDYDFSYNIVKSVNDAYLSFKKDHPEFSVRYIGAVTKAAFFTLEIAEEIMNVVYRLKQEIRDGDEDFILGFDLVGEEDANRSLIEYAPLLAKYKNDHPDFAYFLHSGESINPDSDNLFDAYLLDAKRVGHAVNLYKYPSLLNEYKDKEICIESCLISNQSLGYVKDLRLHPAAEYLKRGLTLVLCSDDPVFFEKETLVDDFFAAIVCWNLSLAEIKHLCINSILYSGLQSKSRNLLMKNWKKNWDNFIEDICQR